MLPASCQTITVGVENGMISPTITFNYPSGADPNFPAVFSHMMTVEDAHLKLVSLLFTVVVLRLIYFF
jgi:hypothetical protein